MQRRAAQDVRSALGAKRILAIDERANFFGLESSGMSQIRGNGCLAATDDEALFHMWLPKKQIHISRGRITSVSRTNSHLRKTVGRPLLLVTFTNDEGHPDSAAWLVGDLEEWESALGS